MNLPRHNIHASPLTCPRCLIELGGMLGLLIITCVVIAIVFSR